MSKSIVVPTGAKGPGILEVTKATARTTSRSALTRLSAQTQRRRQNARPQPQRSTNSSASEFSARPSTRASSARAFRSHYAACYDRDPAGTRSHLHNLEMIPVEDSRHGRSAQARARRRPRRYRRSCNHDEQPARRRNLRRRELLQLRGSPRRGSVGTYTST
jgi:hypothetical protein